ncbi:MAG: molybdopterin-dependent oxidoreductase [Thermodesulfobacteriota bacterium]|nr:molybdopterin-dependent oxidoreductase [Thermodesulfobacteriota bacterium]
MEEIILSINGERFSARAGTSIMELADEQGIVIPRLCYHPELEPFGACRLCLVEDEKSGRMLASCVTPVAPNMSIVTDSPRVLRHRTNIVRLMMAEHPESCIVCNKGNRCQLRQIAANLGLGPTNLYATPNYRPLEQANPFIIRDLSKCILCGKCIRADHELVVTGAIDYNQRGFCARPATVHDRGLEESNCTFCGVCVSMCPTGALSTKHFGYAGTPERESPAICGFCGIGCSLLMGVSYDKVVEVNPAHDADSINGSTLCVRGHFAHDFLNTEERLLTPMIRKQGQLTVVSWDEAIDLAVRRLSDIKKDFGPQSIGFIGSSKCTNEENYLFQKIARVLLGTNHIDNSGSMAGREVLKSIDERIGGRWRTPLSMLEDAESILVLGADPCHSVPVAGYYLKRAFKKGIPLILADPRKTDLVPFSSLWFQTSPNSDADMVNCLAACLWKKFSHDSSYIERFTDGFDMYCDGLSSFNAERLCLSAGLEMTEMEKAVELLKGKKTAVVIGEGILRQDDAIQSVESILNLMLMTGSIGRVGGGLFVLAKENNQAGAWDMGAVPDALPGRRPLRDQGARKEWERTWGTGLSPDPGLHLFRMVEEMEKGNLKALYVMGENPLRSFPQRERVRAALERLDLLVVQDILSSEIAKMAEVLLPGAAFCEKSGSFTNMEGRIQSFTNVVPPPGQAKADWDILVRLAKQMDANMQANTLDRIRDEIARSVPMYSRLNGRRGAAWAQESDAKGLPSPMKEGDKIPFFPVLFAKQKALDDDYPFTALLGGTRYHLGSGTRTEHSDRLSYFNVGGAIEVSLEDGKKLNMRDGDRIRVESRYGALEREICVVKGMRQGLIFVPTGFNGNEALELLDLPASDKTCSLENRCEVKIIRLDQRNRP